MEPSFRPLVHGPALLVLCCFCLAPSLGPAQDGGDGYRTLDSTGARILLQQARDLSQEGQGDSAEALLRGLRDRADQAGLSLWSARAGSALANLLFRRGELVEGERIMRTALTVFEAAHDTAGMALAETNLGLCAKYNGREVEAVVHDLRAIALYEAMPDTAGLAKALGNLGATYADMGDLVQAREHLARAVALLEAAHSPRKGRQLSELSVIVGRQGDQEAALGYAQRAVQAYEQTDDPGGLGVALTRRSKALHELGRDGDALLDADKALATLSDPFGLGDAWLARGEALNALGRRGEALEAFNRAEKLARVSGDLPILAIIDLNRASIHAAMGDHATAYALLQRHLELRDSCGSAEATQAVTRVEMEQAFATKLLTDSLERKLSDRDHRIQLTTERSHRNLIALGGVSLLLLSIGLWSRLRYTRRTRDIILKAQQQLVSSEKQREAEQVRTRIARDVHDELGSELTHINLLVTRERKERAGTPSSERMEEIARLTRDVSSSLSDIVWAVDPQHDSVESLVAHAQHFTERMVDGRAPRVEQRFMHEGPDRVLDSSTKRNLFLVLKEALNNALKYARARTILVSLETDAHRFKLMVKDDGIGFDPGAVRGNGLGNMKARCAALGAELRMTTAPGEGCCVEVEGRFGNFTA